MQQQTQQRRHRVTITPAESGRQLIECTTCGPLRICDDEVHGDAIARIHEEFTGVLIDALDIDR